MRDDTGQLPQSAVQDLVRRVTGQYRLSIVGVHGISHWARVCENGWRLAGATGADPRVIECFAIFHDSCRQSDGGDRGHGARGAALAASLRGEILLDDVAFDLLLEACDCHTRGPRPGAHITVLTCLDADRLDLPRVGIEVRPDLLCTEAARERTTISWAGLRAARRELPRLCAEQWRWSPPLSSCGEK